ncbi:MAG TPA: ATP synthase F1 subunit delta [Candidatus Tumulicola sp.]|nr:ATP synthase F1 subunit delta [Candidatus Tumulicola sp.]
MADEKLAHRYAEAVFSLAAERNQVDRVHDDLAAIARVLEERPAFKEFFTSPVVDRDAKERALSAAFSSRVSEIALHTLLLLVRKRRERLLDALLREYRKLQLAARGAEPLTVTSARALSSAELSALVERLERLYGKKFEVTTVVDPSLIGGVRILMGDRRIDGSVAGRLDALSRTLFATA